MEEVLEKFEITKYKTNNNEFSSWNNEEFNKRDLLLHRMEV
jgi:tmRNA-binding protein